MDKQIKLDTINKFKRNEKDTGSTEVQVAILTERINQLTGHMVANRHDFHTKHSLLSLVGRRRRLLAYLRKESASRYQDLISSLGLRK